MKRLHSIGMLAILGFLVASVFGEEADSISAVPVDPVLAIFTVDSSLFGAGSQSLILAICADGRVFWSDDQVHGGTPYRTGHIEAERVTSMLSKLEDEGLFDEKGLSQAHYGPDSSYTTILVRSKDKCLQMSSWHELFEADGKVVATSHGIVPLEGRNRYDVLKKEPSEYLFFRMMWNEIRLTAAQLTPKDGTRIDNPPLIKTNGEISEK